MKLTSLIAAIALAACVGCGTTATNSFNVVVTVPIAVELAREVYLNHVNTCHCVHQSEYNIAMAAYSAYQRANQAASDTVASYGTNAVPNDVALQALTAAAEASAGDFINLVTATIPAADAANLKAKVPKTIKLK